MLTEDDLIMISALQHYVYCPIPRCRGAAKLAYANSEREFMTIKEGYAQHKTL